jgi:inner membrane protein
MPSPVSHAIVGASLWPLFRTPEAPRRVWIVGATLAVLPDIDFVGYQLGVRYETLFGHRGITHSILFALVAATVAWALVRRSARATGGLLSVWLYLALAALSHTLLDAMTNGGAGVALFAPFDNSRYFFPFRPILVSPLSIQRFLTARGVAILLNEAAWIWVPAAALALLGTARSRRWLKTPA